MQPAKPRRNRRPLYTRLIVLAVIAVIAIGYSVYKSSQNAKVSSNGAVTKAGSLSVFSLAKGQCFNEPATGQDVSTVKAIPCSQPHDAQVTGTATLTETTYDETAINTDAGNQCSTVADDAVVSNDLGENASVIYFVPDEDDFNTNADRTVTCAGDNGGTKLNGSVLKSGD